MFIFNIEHTNDVYYVNYYNKKSYYVITTIKSLNFIKNKFKIVIYTY